MKHSIKFFATMLLLAATSMAFNSCGDDDPPVDPAKVIGATATIDFVANAEMFTVFDIEAYAIDSNGKETKLEKSDNTTNVDGQHLYVFKSSKSDSKVPVSAAIKVTFALKADAPEKADLVYGTICEGIVRYDQPDHDIYAKSSDGLVDVKGLRVHDYFTPERLEKLNKSYENVNVTVDANGLVK